MKATIGLNLLAQTLQNRDETVAAAKRIGGGAILVMDDPALARELRRTMPLVIHRRYLDLNNDGDGDEDELYKRLPNPTDWLDIIRPDVMSDVVIQCHNEPVVDSSNVGDFVRWNVAMLEAAHARGIRVAVGTFAVGNPHESLITAGAFDPMLRALNANDVLMVHEYFREHPTAAPEYPWLCGRVEWWIDRLKAVGSACRTVVIGEYGRDIGGGENDGWRGTGWSAEAYAVKLVDGMQDIYKPLAAKSGVTIHALVFCGGRGFGDRWQSFNIEGERRIYNEMEAWNVLQNAVTPPPPPVVVPVPKPSNPGQAVAVMLRDTEGQGINVRTAPTRKAQRLATLTNNTPLLWYPATSVQSDGFTWYWVEASAAAGWMALIAASTEAQFVVVNPPQMPVFVADVPYYNQITSPGAQFDRNDCAEACTRMLIGWLLRRANLQDFPGITIDDLTRDAGKSPHSFMSLGQLERLLRLYGFPEAKCTYGGVTLERIEEEVKAGRPLIALVRYKHLKPGDSFTGAHFVCVIGFSMSEVIVHDPLRGGANMRVPRNRFELALTDWGDTNPHHSGVFVSVGARLTVAK